MSQELEIADVKKLVLAFVASRTAHKEDIDKIRPLVSGSDADLEAFIDAILAKSNLGVMAGMLKPVVLGFAPKIVEGLREAVERYDAFECAAVDVNRLVIQQIEGAG